MLEVATTWDRVSGWLLGDGLRILATVVVAGLARWVLHRTIDRFVAASTSLSLSTRFTV